MVPGPLPTARTHLVVHCCAVVVTSFIAVFCCRTSSAGGCQVVEQCRNERRCFGGQGSRVVGHGAQLGAHRR